MWKGDAPIKTAGDTHTRPADRPSAGARLLSTSISDMLIYSNASGDHNGRRGFKWVDGVCDNLTSFSQEAVRLCEVGEAPAATGKSVAPGTPYPLSEADMYVCNTPYVCTPPFDYGPCALPHAHVP